MRQPDPIGLAKAILWEEAKGKLRAMVAAEGSNMPDYSKPQDNPPRFEQIEKVVEKFIKKIEDEGLQE